MLYFHSSQIGVCVKGIPKILALVSNCVYLIKKINKLNIMLRIFFCQFFKRYISYYKNAHFLDSHFLLTVKYFAMQSTVLNILLC